MPRTEALKRAQAKYDKKRPAPVSVRLTAAELAWLDLSRNENESRSQALKRLAFPPLTKPA